MTEWTNGDRKGVDVNNTSIAWAVDVLNRYGANLKLVSGYDLETGFWRSVVDQSGTILIHLPGMQHDPEAAQRVNRRRKAYGSVSCPQ